MPARPPLVQPHPGQERSVNEGAPGETVIQTPDRRLRVFVSSTLEELAEERRAVSRAISSLRLTPVLFELGARPHPPQEVYRAYLEQSDVFIGLYWQRYWQAGPGMKVSGLEEEFDLSSGLPRLLYIKAPAPDREPQLADLLGRIRQQASYRTFGTPTELGKLVRDDLAVLLSERFTARARPAAPISRGPRPLPVSTTSLVDREQAIGEVAGMLAPPGGRLVTLTGPGGIGKTRLALAVAERVRDRFGAGMVFVPLAEVTDPWLVLPGISRALDADLVGAGPPLEALAEPARRRRLAAHPGQPRAGARGRQRPGRVAFPLPWSGDLGHQSHGTGTARRAGVSGAAAAAACRPRRRVGGGTGSLPGGGAVRGPGPGGTPRLHPHRGQRPGGGGDLPPTGGPATGHRAGRRPHTAARPGHAAGPAGHVAGRARNGHGGHARAPTHPARHG